MQFITIHCQPTLLETIQQLGLDYEDTLSEINVHIPFTIENEDVNKSIKDEIKIVIPLTLLNREVCPPRLLLVT